MDDVRVTSMISNRRERPGIYYDILNWYTAFACSSDDSSVYCQLNLCLPAIESQFPGGPPACTDSLIQVETGATASTGPFTVTLWHRDSLGPCQKSQELPEGPEGDLDSAQTYYRWISDHPCRRLYYCNMLVHTSRYYSTYDYSTYSSTLIYINSTRTYQYMLVQILVHVSNC